MLQLVNHTPFEPLLGLFTDSDGHDIASVVLAATLAIPAKDGAVCRSATQQLAPQPAPSYVGEPGRSSILRPADLVPGKPGTDVVLLGHAYAPRGRRVTELPVSVQVGHLRKTLVIIGDRQWVRGRLGAAMSKPVPFERMPLVYERAFGGCPPSQRGAERPDLDERNPVGTGYCASRRDVDQMRLPNLEDPRYRIQRWRDTPPIAGLGAIDAHWTPRRRLAGTYDATWRAWRCPLLPADFDPRFHSVASAGLGSREPLRGELEVTLVHLAIEPVLRFRLPGLRVCMAFHRGGELDEHCAELWTLVLEPDEQRVSMVWGARCRIGKCPSRLRHVVISTEDL
jgi:hypothetical protein